MNSLWARAAQAQSACRCRICLHSGRLAVRRSTTAASRRKVTAADIFTACYTTILGTATIIDSHCKEARKRELDDKLEKARAALCNLGAQESTGQQGERRNPPDADAVIAPATHSYRTGGGRSDVVDALLRELGVSPEISRRPLLTTSWMRSRLEWLQIEAAIIAEEQDPECVLREPASTPKLQRTTDTVVKMVEQLLQCSVNCESTRQQDGREMGEQAARSEAGAWIELKDMLQTPFYPSYHHPFTDPEETSRSRLLLGNSIRRIFNHAASSREIVAKICYNILACSAPPTIHTYNELIAGFNRIERPDLAQIVVDSYINDTAWPATQQTILCLLGHFRARNQVDGMRDIILRMRGVRETGLHFRIVSKDAIYSQDWLGWATNYSCSRKYSWVQRAQRNDEIYDSIIKSWLQFGELGNASRAFVACLRQGCSVTIETLQALLLACLTTTDFANIRRLVIGIAKNRREFVAFANHIVHRESLATSRQVMESLLRILDMYWRRLGNNLGRISAAYGPTLLRMKSFIHGTQSKLEMRETGRPSIDTPNVISKERPEDIAVLYLTQQIKRWSNQTLISSIGRRYQNLEAKIKITTSLANATILKIKTGYRFKISFLGSKGRDNPRIQHRHDCLCRALHNIEIHPGPMTMEDIRLQLLRNLPDSRLARYFENSGNSESISIGTLASFYGPNSDAPIGPESDTLDESIKQLEHQFAQIEDTVRATLFAYLTPKKQKQVRFWYPNWNDMSVLKLVEYHMRRRSLRVSTAAETKQTFAATSCDQENPAERSSKEMSTVVQDAYNWDHGDTERGLESNRPRHRSAGPSVLHGDPHPPFAASG
ncbi:hypothetical protein GGR53DRAFT_501052 [Hypoxylon sp. FL1150]|nr:hypothetical protein GGR53DRAFT_501052 [Hypoxylon sp. FL1150]